MNPQAFNNYFILISNSTDFVSKNRCCEDNLKFYAFFNNIGKQYHNSALLFTLSPPSVVNVHLHVVATKTTNSLKNLKRKKNTSRKITNG